MASQREMSFTFAVEDFKRLETPLDQEGYRDFICVVDVTKLPDLSEWGKSNLRDPKDKGKIPQLIREGLFEEDLFVFMNRGLVIACQAVEFDNRTKEVTLTLSDHDVHGLIDGGHTHLILHKEREELLQKLSESDDPLIRHVRVEILKGFDRSEIKDIAGARNTSNQVREESLLNLEGRFEGLRRALEKETFANYIAYKEYETYSDDCAKPIDVRDVISMLYMFDTETFVGQKHPINGYRSKTACLSDFNSRTDGRDSEQDVYQKLYPLAPEILKLHDRIHKQLPELYNKARRAFGEDVKGGKFGNLKGVLKRKKGDVELRYLGERTEYRIPEGFVYPMLAGFRALIEERSGYFQWIKGCDPLKLLEGEMGLQMANAVGETARRDQNPSKTGKDASLWHSCYQAATIAKQSIEIQSLQRKVGKTQ